ncbi:copper chaperone PCu(A)C [Vibrio sp. SS-MA-C1-2]|uniref:copper chaperone PCu(A)C n=1 Tax=Vibrio sp. SS-MA-C1-2 TaxID=2908646 RepID=UPI001F3FB2C2|nr:copper chaperone PCu(A)C [Vibrio sp. SS-MA-C1-2]UJF17283.1 copper chaperone PCu(A)C [Vibrio sp. SS-MA-C1-2]
MKKILATLGLLASFNSHAGLELTHCLIAEPAPSSTVTGIFFDIKFNVTDEIAALRLPSQESIQGASIEGLASSVEIHETMIDKGVMKMNRLNQFKLQPNKTHHFQKGGPHLMIRDFTKRPVAGEEYTLRIWSNYIDEPTCIAKVVKSSEIPVKKMLK